MKELDVTFYCAGNDYNFTPAQSTLKKVDLYQVAEPTSEIPCPTGWNNLTGVDTLYINDGAYHFEDLWNFTESSPLDLSGMTSLKDAMIRVNQLESFAVPASLKSLELSTKSSVSFAPAGVEELNLDAQGKQITLGDSQSLKTLTLYAGADDASANAVTLGACPNLEELIMNVSGGKLSLGGASYPKLKTFRIAKGKHISTIPSATVFPALEVLSISGSGYGSREIGIGTLDAAQYTNLKQLYIGGLDDGYSYRNYNNRYYNGYSYSIRSKGSFVISEAQFNAAKAYTKANSGREIFSGITGSNNVALDENDNWVDVFQYNVNSIYKVVDTDGNKVPIADSDYTDGEISTIVNSQTN